ncbi:hypothetical protein ACH4WW_21625 [Streptomyces halstedii]|uniref:hypothetical protein n=1 Tax=Streptomyces TaxID=1883 RepID=UPI000805717D|nr:hypothetical protein [Streptomyces sp. OspMP-M45]MYR73993.1 hypothetical protein [Streptomyces sp. SID4925]SBU97873.1 hypothetical protein YUMDRAFT_05959 [Streptomyces sp. OspMP-M45]
MRRARTIDRSTSSALLLLAALLFAQLCVQGHTGLTQGHTGLKEESGPAAPRGPVAGVALSASAGGHARAGLDVPAPAAGETATYETEHSYDTKGSCPQRQAPERSGGPRLVAPAAAELPSPGEAPVPQTTRWWSAHGEGPSAKAPPPHVSVLRI